jgi:hypothetical protein
MVGRGGHRPASATFSLILPTKKSQRDREAGMGPIIQKYAKADMLGRRGKKVR